MLKIPEPEPQDYRVPIVVPRKAVFTTGQAAKIMKISQQAVIRLFDSGELKGFRVPGSTFRRIPYELLIKFINEQKDLVAIEDTNPLVEAIHLVDKEPEKSEEGTAYCKSLFELGALLQQHTYATRIVIKRTLQQDPDVVKQQIETTFKDARKIKVVLK